MKRKVILPIILGGLVVVSSIIYGVINIVDTKNKTSSTQQIQTVATDKTVNVNSIDFDRKDVMDIRISPSFAKFYPNPQELLAESDAAVYAKVENIEFFVLGGAPWTKMDVIVLDPIKGDLQANDKISIVQFGGYIPLKEQIEYYHDEDKFASMSTNEIENTVLKKVIDSEPLPEVGEKGVYFLVTNSTPGLPEGAYQVNSAYQGKYIENEKGILERYAPDDGYYLTDAQRKARSIPTNLLENGERPYTYKQMKSVLNS